LKGDKKMNGVLNFAQASWKLQGPLLESRFMSHASPALFGELALNPTGGETPTDGAIPVDAR